jgi:hypothetical protein
MIAKSADLTILDDWYATGMSATGSNTVVAENVFVPARRTMPLPAMLEGKYPARHNADNPYFRYPLAPVLTVNAGGTPSASRAVRGTCLWSACPAAASPTRTTPTKPKHR